MQQSRRIGRRLRGRTLPSRSSDPEGNLGRDVQRLLVEFLGNLRLGREVVSLQNRRAIPSTHGCTDHERMGENGSKSSKVQLEVTAAKQPAAGKTCERRTDGPHAAVSSCAPS